MTNQAGRFGHPRNVRNVIKKIESLPATTRDDVELPPLEKYPPGKNLPPGEEWLLATKMHIHYVYGATIQELAQATGLRVSAVHRCLQQSGVTFSGGKHRKSNM